MKLRLLWCLMLLLLIIYTIFAQGPSTSTAHWNHAIPMNNQCPVCGLMSAPYSRGEYLSKMIQGDPHNTIWRSMTVDNMPTSQLTRCWRCNAAFYRDAEDLVNKGRGK